MLKELVFVSYLSANKNFLALALDKASDRHVSCLINIF